MMWYVLKLIVLLPVIGVLAWGCLTLARRLQDRVNAASGPKAARIVEMTMLSPGHKLAVIAFHDREILVAVSRGGMTRLAEAPARQGEAR